jgi:PHD/YefM family antitoxin component YafN of YafNO toxin-antitoxin module
MRTIQMPKELQPLLKFAEASEQDTVVLTDKKRPVAALVSLRKVDRESLALSTNPQFLRIIQAARKEVRAGRTISLESLERKFEIAAPRKATRQRPSRRRVG